MCPGQDVALAHGHNPSATRHGKSSPSNNTDQDEVRAMHSSLWHHNGLQRHSNHHKQKDKLMRINLYCAHNKRCGDHPPFEWCTYANEEHGVMFVRCFFADAPWSAAQERAQLEQIAEEEVIANVKTVVENTKSSRKHKARSQRAIQIVKLRTNVWVRQRTSWFSDATRKETTKSIALRAGLLLLRSSQA